MASASLRLQRSLPPRRMEESPQQRAEEAQEAHPQPESEPTVADDAGPQPVAPAESADPAVEATAPTDDAAPAPTEATAPAETAAPEEAAAPAGAAPAAAAPQQDAAVQEEGTARRALRRERHRAEVERRRRWDIRRSLADISADVELLTQEVARCRHACMPAHEPPRELTPAERQQLRLLHARRQAEIVSKQCGAVLRHVQAHKWAWPFNEPVELDRYPDYTSVVPQPMDFGTIRRRIDAGAYGGPAAFAADMALVWANARAYNAVGSDVWHMVGTLQERFDDKWNSTVLPKIAEDEAACRTDEANMRRRIAEAGQRAASEALATEAARLGAHFEALDARIEEAKSQAAAACQPMPRERKRRLVEDLGRLSPEQYEWAIAIILARYPGAAAQAQAAATAGAKTGGGGGGGGGAALDELSLDLSAADALTLRQLQHYVGACLGGHGDAPAPWPGLLVGSGVRAFKAPRGKRPRTARSAADLRTPAHQSTPDGGAVFAQRPPMPVHSQPFLTVKLPGMGADAPQQHLQQQQFSPALTVSVPSGTPGSLGPLTAQGSSTVPSIPAGVVALVQPAAGAEGGYAASLPPDSVTHDGFKVPPLPKHRTQSLPASLPAAAPAYLGGAPQPAAAAEVHRGAVALAKEAGEAPVQAPPADSTGSQPAVPVEHAGSTGAAQQQQQPTVTGGAEGAAPAPGSSTGGVMNAQQISDVCAMLHSDVLPQQPGSQASPTEVLRNMR